MFVLFACTPPPDTDGDGPGVEQESVAETGTPPDTGTTTPPIDSGTTIPVDPDCLEPLPLGPLQFTTINRIHTEEDFDFDGEGRLIAQNNNNLVGYPRNGDQVTLSPNIGIDAAGIRALPTGDFVVAQPDTGVVKLINGATGGSTNAATGLNGPNGLEVGLDSMVYVSEFRNNGGLRMLEPYSGTIQVLIGGTPINAIALSPDERVIYVSSFGYYGGGGGGFDGIAALDREDTASEWQLPPRVVMPASTLIQGLTTDKCGNLYAVESSTGELFRYNVADETVDRLASLASGYGFFSSARFGAGFGGWKRNELYVTDRSRIYVIDVGIDGRHVLAQ